MHMYENFKNNTEEHSLIQDVIYVDLVWEKEKKFK